VYGDMGQMNSRQRNMVWAMFTEQYYRQLYTDWELLAKDLLGRFRSACGKYVEDPWLTQFIDDLRGQSVEFDRWWPLHELQDDGGVYKQLNHPVAGIMDFESSSYDVPDSGLRLFIHVPMPDTDTAAKMKSLLG